LLTSLNPFPVSLEIISGNGATGPKKTYKVK
jgi:hypothetical protein